jgi:hypothetical protein
MDADADGPPAGSGLRSQAVQLLISFMGASLGSPYAASAFAQQALNLYSRGVPAARVLAQLRSREFAQGGGLLPVIQQEEVFQEVNKQLFARWVSRRGLAGQLRRGLPGPAEPSRSPLCGRPRRAGALPAAPCLCRHPPAHHSPPQPATPNRRHPPPLPPPPAGCPSPT